MLNDHSFFSWLLEASLSITMLWLVYHFAFRSWTFFALNRAILMFGVICCLIVPFLPLSTASESFVAEGWKWVPVFNSTAKSASVTNTVTQVADLSVMPYVWSSVIVIYFFGLLVSATRFVRGIVKLYGVKSRAESISQDSLANVWVQSEMPTYSFFGHVFLHADVLSLPVAELATVRRHEEAHVRQWHSVDNVFFEILSIVFWFHPCVKRLSRGLRDVHEYLADQYAMTELSSVIDYQRLLARFAAGAVRQHVVHTFSDS